MSGDMRIAIAGLGQVAWKFDQDPKRNVVWTHLGGYRANGVAIAGACDPSPQAREDFSAKYPDIPLYADVGAMMKAVDPQIVSICAPAEQHFSTLCSILESSNVKAIWCEKPLATKIADAQSMVDACKRQGVLLIVNHSRRWSPLWKRVRALVKENAVGTLRLVRISMPNRLWTIGSHAVDLATMLGGDIDKVATIDLPDLEEDGEAARSALLRFANGASGAILVTGFKDRLIVDAEIIGDRGTILAREDRGELTVELFESSARFGNYLERGPVTREKHSTMTDFSPFTAAAREVLDGVTNPGAAISCSGDDALRNMHILDRMAQRPVA